MMCQWFTTIPGALRRARVPTTWMAATYLLGVTVGAVMVHHGNAFALHRSDSLVNVETASSPVSAAMRRGLPLRAAFLDFAGNLLLGAVPSTVMGISVALPFPLAAYRGWIGGIVSVDGKHRSRLRPSRERWYYLVVVLLQLLPYTLAGGTGIRLGLAFLRPASPFGYPGSSRWMGLPAEGVLDVLRIYTLVIPLFLVASVIEFLAR